MTAPRSRVSRAANTTRPPFGVFDTLLVAFITVFPWIVLVAGFVILSILLLAAGALVGIFRWW